MKYIVTQHLRASKRKPRLSHSSQYSQKNTFVLVKSRMQWFSSNTFGADPSVVKHIGSPAAGNHGVALLLKKVQERLPHPVACR